MALDQMKKLSLYVFLVLMLASCSEYQKKKAIENCADLEFHIFAGDSSNFWSAFIEKSTRELKKYEKQYILKHIKHNICLSVNIQLG